MFTYGMFTFKFQSNILNLNVKLVWNNDIDYSIILIIINNDIHLNFKTK